MADSKKAQKTSAIMIILIALIVFFAALNWNNSINIDSKPFENFKQAKDQPKASTIEKELKTLGNSLNGKEKEISNVTKYLIQDIIKESEANTQLKRIRTEIVDINLKIERKTETLNSLSKLENDIKTYDDEIVNLRLSSSFDDRKKIIEKHLKEIKIINIDGYFTIDLIFKSFYFNERFIIEKNYKMHIVDIDTDDEYRAKGHKNLIDWEMNVYDWEKDINDWGKPVWDLVNRKI